MNEENQNQNPNPNPNQNQAGMLVLQVLAGVQVNIAAGVHLQVQQFIMDDGANLNLGAGAQIIAQEINIGADAHIILEEGAQFLQMLNDGVVVPFLGDNNDGE